jgi:hypothetical protein
LVATEAMTSAAIGAVAGGAAAKYQTICPVTGLVSVLGMAVLLVSTQASLSWR